MERIVCHNFLEKATIIGLLVSWEGLVASRLVDKICDCECWSLVGLRYIAKPQRALAKGHWVGWHGHMSSWFIGAAKIIKSALTFQVKQFPHLQLWDVGELSIPIHSESEVFNAQKSDCKVFWFLFVFKQWYEATELTLTLIKSNCMPLYCQSIQLKTSLSWELSLKTDGTQSVIKWQPAGLWEANAGLRLEPSLELGVRGRGEVFELNKASIL